MMTTSDLFRVVGYYDDEKDECFCREDRPPHWRDLLALVSADIPGVDRADDPPLCTVCGHYL